MNKSLGIFFLILILKCFMKEYSIPIKYSSIEEDKILGKESNYRLDTYFNSSEDESVSFTKFDYSTPICRILEPEIQLRMIAEYRNHGNSAFLDFSLAGDNLLILTSAPSLISVPMREINEMLKLNVQESEVIFSESNIYYHSINAHEIEGITHVFLINAFQIDYIQLKDFSKRSIKIKTLVVTKVPYKKNSIQFYDEQIVICQGDSVEFYKLNSSSKDFLRTDLSINSSFLNLSYGEYNFTDAVVDTSNNQLLLLDKGSHSLFFVKENQKKNGFEYVSKYQSQNVKNVFFEDSSVFSSKIYILREYFYGDEIEELVFDNDLKTWVQTSVKEYGQIENLHVHRHYGIFYDYSILHIFGAGYSDHTQFMQTLAVPKLSSAIIISRAYNDSYILIAEKKSFYISKVYTSLPILNCLSEAPEGEHKIQIKGESILCEAKIEAQDKSSSSVCTANLEVDLNVYSIARHRLLSHLIKTLIACTIALGIILSVIIGVIIYLWKNTRTKINQYRRIFEQSKDVVMDTDDRNLQVKNPFEFDTSESKHPRKLSI